MFSQINPITRTEIDSQLADALTDWFHIAEIPVRKAANACQDAKARLVVPELAELARVDLGLANFYHSLTIVHAFARCKAGL